MTMAAMAPVSSAKAITNDFDFIGTEIQTTPNQIKPSHSHDNNIIPSKPNATKSAPFRIYRKRG
jgi:hypothetical protein